MALKESTAKWKFVIGHHAIRSVSIHGDTTELVEELLPVLKVDKFLAHNPLYEHCNLVEFIQIISNITG